jgi:hypothetical protein
MTMATSPKNLALRVIAELAARELVPIVRDVCRQHGVTLEEVCGEARKWSFVRARREAWWRLRNLPERHYTVDDIARIFGRASGTVGDGLRIHARQLAAATDTPKVSHD